MAATRIDADAFLGIDLGTSGVKALLADPEGTILAEGTGELGRLTAAHPLQAEQEAEAWWQATVTAIQVCLAAAPRARVLAVGLTGQKHALLALDENDRPLRPAVLWADGRARAEAEEMRLVFPAAARRTGALPLPGFLIPKWLRFLRTEPLLAGRTRRLCFAKDYLRLRLTGTFATDRTEASASQAYDFRSNTWSALLLALFNLPAEVLPPVLPSTVQAGEVSPDGAAQTGLPVGIPVAAGAGDNEAAALGCGALGQGRVAVVLGTSGTVTGWARFRANAGGISWNRHVLASGYAGTGTVLSAGRSLEWIRRAAFGRRFDIPQVLEAAAASDPKPAPLVFLPSLVGERSPVPDPLATGAFVGLRPAHGRGHLARAVVDGISLSLAEILTLMRGAGVELTELRLTSGGAASPFWRSTIAAAARLPVRLVSQRGGPALGAAMLGAAMLRSHGSLGALVETWIAPGPVEAPDPSEVQRLRDLLARQRAVRTALRGVNTR